ncbi:hypothetical protein [Cohnella phaseoli]|uniref:Beta-agarase/YXIM esterase-like galactose-binding domain-containing protein n=1 Tax=Cohnella phaseoli TaxID=456490 RepID=A0A3D9IP11_9BACL|nr:hypothetical protein [Cohnella phaseoli]RED63533.1 hypothetical protein DFP98_12580 [Cohnella phaseoli]
MAGQWKFDFGIGAAADGYTKITADCEYDPERGYGFTDLSRVTARDRKAPGVLKRDLCIPVDTTFRVDVPDGITELIASGIRSSRLWPLAMYLR